MKTVIWQEKGKWNKKRFLTRRRAFAFARWLQKEGKVDPYAFVGVYSVGTVVFL